MFLYIHSYVTMTRFLIKRLQTELIDGEEVNERADKAPEPISRLQARLQK